MNSTWQEFLGAAGARFSDGIVTDFGDPAAELAAVNAETIVAPLSHLAIVEVAGGDAGDFLHQQLTSDVKHLHDNAAQHSAWCSAKGRMLASFLLFRSGADYRLQMSADLLPAIAERLRMFVLRSRVTVIDHSGQCALIGLCGPQSTSILQDCALPTPAAAMTLARFAAGVVLRLADTRFEIIVDGDGARTLWPTLARYARPVGAPVWQWLEVRAGVPLISERTREEFVPQMAHFERFGGVSFHKGCYPGQEVIARTQYLGKVKRHLYRIRSAAPIAAGDALYSPAHPEQPCGMVANAAPAPSGGYEALAVVQESYVAAGILEWAKPGGARVDVESSPL